MQRRECVWPSEAGFLWVGTQDGLNRWDGYAFTTYQYDPQDPMSLPAATVAALAEDDTGRLWVATRGGGISSWDPSSETFRSFRHEADDPESLGADRVMALHKDSGGLLWVGTQGGGLSRWNPHSDAFELYRRGSQDDNTLSSNSVMAFSTDAQGRVWIGTLGEGLDRLDRSTDRPVNSCTSDTIPRMPAASPTIASSPSYMTTEARSGWAPRRAASIA